MESKEISPRIAYVPIFAASVYSYKLQPKQRRAPLRNKMPEKSIKISYYYFLIKLFSVKSISSIERLKIISRVSFRNYDGNSLESSPNRTHFIFEIYGGNSRIGRGTRLNLNLQSIFNHSISESFYVGSDINFKNIMAWV